MTTYPADRTGWSLSHASGFVCCAVADIPIDAVGVDAEPLSSGDRLAGMAEVFVSDADARWLSDEPRERLRQLVELWTVKEAALKAHGTGIAAAGGFDVLKALECTPDVPQDDWTPVRVRDARTDEVCRAWVRHLDEHVMAAARLDGAPAAPRLVRMRLQ